jgi:glutamate-5-semialdehyde dehydrogenase
MTTREILLCAKRAAPRVAALGIEDKNNALRKMADALLEGEEKILAANREEVALYADTLGEVMVDRLSLTPARIAAMADGIRQVADLPDPVGLVLSEDIRPNGLRIKRVSVPLGVVGMIYESRPNVTADAAALCFKSGNACVLKAGKEAHKTARVIADCLKKALMMHIEKF